MSSNRYTEEFKIEAVKQVTGRGYSVAEVAERLGTATNSLYAFIRDHRSEFSVRAICRVFKVHLSGFYARLETPLSNRAMEDQRLLTLIKQFYLASGGTYGSPWIHRDLRESGETCSVHRVARTMREGTAKLNH